MPSVTVGSFVPSSSNGYQAQDHFHEYSDSKLRGCSLRLPGSAKQIRKGQPHSTPADGFVSPNAGTRPDTSAPETGQQHFLWTQGRLLWCQRMMSP